MTLDEIRRGLRDRRIDIVARATGLHRNTVYAIREGRAANPKWETVAALAKYLEDAGNTHGSE